MAKARPEDIAGAVRAAMVRREMTQVDLARESGVDRAQINRWLKGRGTVTVRSAEAVMRVLRLRVQDMEGA
jgi:transcriptional regulator with XRE-family HTH domain